MPTPLRVLLIDDSETDAELLVRELRRAGYEPSWERVETAAALIDTLRRQAWDIVTCDWVMPRFSAEAALAVLAEHALDTPIIIVSGEVGDEIAVTAMRAGAHDVVSKQRLTRLVPAIERELREGEVRRAKRRAEDALRAAHARLDFALTASRAGVWDWDLAADTTEYSPHWQKLLGYSSQEMGDAADWLAIVHPEDRTRLTDYVRDYVGHPSSHYEVEFRVRDKQGAERWLLSRATGVFSPSGAGPRSHCTSSMPSWTSGSGRGRRSSSWPTRSSKPSVIPCRTTCARPCGRSAASVAPCATPTGRCSTPTPSASSIGFGSRRSTWTT